MDDQFFYLIKDLGFPMFVALILLYDKIKTRDNLMEVVKANTAILSIVKDKLMKN